MYVFFIIWKEWANFSTVLYTEPSKNAVNTCPNTSIKTKNLYDLIFRGTNLYGNFAAPAPKMDSSEWMWSNYISVFCISFLQCRNVSHSRAEQGGTPESKKPWK